MTSDPRKPVYARAIADYVRQHERWDAMSKWDVAVHAASVMMEDIGAAQEFLNVLGIPYDLYDDRYTDGRESGFSGFRTVKLKRIGTDAYGRNVVKEVNMKRGIKQVLKYAAFFFAGSAAAGWAIADQAKDGNSSVFNEVVKK